jgi:transcriptional regulator with XRE-family HTH domain
MTPQSASARVGAAIRAERQRLRVSLEAIAGAAGLSEGSLSRLETGSRSISVDQVVAIAGALGTDPRALFDAVVDETPAEAARREIRETLVPVGQAVARLKAAGLTDGQVDAAFDVLVWGSRG